jgi:molybdopterin-guanine dinucleotide biosynthesis protein
MTAPDQPPRAAIGAPAGSGKTALMEQLCKRLRLDAIVAFLRAKGGLKGARDRRGGGRRRPDATKSDDSETHAALFCRVDDIKMANLGTSGRRRALTP